LQATLAEPQAAVAAALERNPSLKPHVEHARLADTIAGELEHPDAASLGLGAIAPERLQRAVNLLAGSQGLNLPPGVSLYTAEFLPPLAERRIA
jgi:NitT/TauT family transport system substrate-binding protein